jgi:hypothetical protein
MKQTAKTLLRFALRSAVVLSVVWLLLLLAWAAEGV